MKGWLSNIGKTLHEKCFVQETESSWAERLLAHFLRLEDDQLERIYEHGLTESDCQELFDEWRLDPEFQNSFVERFNFLLKQHKPSASIEEDNEIMKNFLICGVLCLALAGLGYFAYNFRNRDSDRKRRPTSPRSSSSKPYSPQKIQEGLRIKIADESLLRELKTMFQDHSQGSSFFSGNGFILNEASCARLNSYGYFKPESIGKLQALVANADNEVHIIQPKLGDLFDNSVARTISPYVGGKILIKEVISLGLQKTNGTVILPAIVDTEIKGQD